MRPIFPTPSLFALLAVFALASSPAQAQDSSDLNGAWIVTSWTDAEGVLDEAPQRGVFIFSVTREDGGSYSMMFATGDGPRPEYEGEDQTDEETLQAYASFTANTGRLQIEGNTLTYEAYVAKDPNYMAAFEENGADATWLVEDNTLTLEFNSGFLEGWVATFRRPMSGE